MKPRSCPGHVNTNTVNKESIMAKTKHKNPSAKGGAFERLVCTLLSLWITYGKDKDVFWRSASSGGRSTNAVRKGGKAKQYQSSDVAPVSPAAYPLLNSFVIECKHYRSLQLDLLAFAGKSKIRAFWEQAVRDASRVNKRPMLVARQNGKPVLLGLRVDDYYWFLNLHLKDRKFPKAVISTRLNLALVDFEVFLKVVDPAVLETYAS